MDEFPEKIDDELHLWRKDLNVEIREKAHIIKKGYLFERKDERLSSDLSNMPFE